ncbi:MAG: hypothetical protein ABH828_03460 [archaeon]
MAKNKDPVMDGFVGIGASLGGIFLVIVLFFLIFAQTQAALLIPLAWAFAVLGIALGFFAYLTKKPRK